MDGLSKASRRELEALESRRPGPVREAINRVASWLVVTAFVYGLLFVSFAVALTAPLAHRRAVGSLSFASAFARRSDAGSAYAG